MQPWTFLHAADMQPGSPRSFRFRVMHDTNWRTAHAQLMGQTDAELLLVGGDLTRDGNLHDFEYEAARADLDALPYPYHAIPGNMDVGNKPARGQTHDRGAATSVITERMLDDFARWFGDFPWSFTHRNVRFSGLYAAVAGTGLPHEQRLWRWLEDELPAARAADRDAGVTSHVVVMHYPLFIDRPDEPTWDLSDPQQYTSWYFSIDQPHRARMLAAFGAAGVDVVISGHIHCRRPVQVFEGIRFYKCPGIAFPQWADRWPDGDPRLGFLRFEVTDAGVGEPTFVPLTEECRDQAGYGPGGHPTPEQRDYSLAWER